MEVKDGYKKTEIGVIPVDWDVKPLEYLCKPSGLVRGPFGGALKKEYFVKSGYKVYEQRNAIYKNSNIGNYYINKDKFEELARFAVKQGDFIISCSGTIGKIFQIPKNHKQGVINQALLKLTIDSSKAVDKFFEVYFSWDRFQDKIIDSTQGGAMKNLVGMDVFKKTLIAIPPIPEQQAIAEALSDVDAVVSSLTKLINKKKNIKQGAIQELLTGKKRLEGFSEKWTYTNLGSVCKIYRGGSPRPIHRFLTDSNNGINWIKIGDVNVTAKYINSTKEKIISEGKAYSREVYKGDLILSNSMSFGRPYILNIDGCIHDGWLVIQNYQDTFALHFLYYFLCSDGTMEQYISMAAGSSVQNLNKDKVSSLKVPIFSIEEQTAIASILSDMDAEIEALEQKLNKYKAIKQGMMQELLTGRIRLI